MIVGSLPFIVIKPHFGVLIFSWFSYMNPHRLAWGFMTTLPWAFIVGALTFAAWVFSRENKKCPMTPVTILMIAFVLWCTLTTATAYVQDDAWTYWLRYIKIMSMIFLTMILFQDHQRLHVLIWTIVVSIGFYGVKGGVFSVLMGGSDRVWGPMDSFIADNNALAMALIMLIPYARYLQLQAKDRRVRIGLMIGIGLMLFSILASYSRGGFLGLACMLMFLAMKSKHRLGYGLLIVVAMVGTLSFMPDKYFDRLSTVETEAQSGTASTRIASWIFALEVANANPIVGGGFEFMVDENLVLKYAPPAAISGWTQRGPIAFNLHSIYFQVLGTQGWVGFIIFVMILYLAYRSCGWVRRRTKHRPDLAWAANLASLTQVSMVGMLTAGAFQNLAFFDLFWHVIAIAVLVRLIAERELAKPAPESEPALEPSRPGPRTRVAPRPQIVRPVSSPRPAGPYRHTSAPPGR
jgi:probable O-glycosylation ligase (exosortase A-associated)